jgi:hypothetical protein
MGASQLDRFVESLHRRLLVIRALESSACGALAGCVLAAGLMPLLLWRGQPALPPTAGALAAGALAGLAWSITRRPTRLDAAAEADRQLDLADLLGTALTIARSSRDPDRDPEAAPWLQTVLAVADATCARHTPAEVILHRLHARAWGGIALAAVGVVSVAAFTTQPPRARAASDGSASTPLQAFARPFPRDASPRPAAAPAERPSPEGSSRARQPDPAASASDDPASAESPDERSSASPGNRSATGDNGTAGGSARARTTKANESPPGPGARPHSPASPSAEGAVAGGSGAGASAAPTGVAGAPIAGTAGNGAATPAVPPWRTTQWPTDVRRAHDAINAGEVPDAYRDLVRDYFDRP